MKPKIEILYPLFPFAINDVTNYDVLKYKLENKATYNKHEDLKIHLISNRKIIFKDTKLTYFSYSTNTLFIKNPFFFIMYFIITIMYGIKTIKKNKNIHIISNLGGHVYLGFISYIISRITGRKHLLRINDDTVLSAKIFLQNIKIFNAKIIMRIILDILRIMENYLFTNTDWIITHGLIDYERIKQVTKKCSFIPLSIDIEKFKPYPKSKFRILKENLAGQNKVILFVGRLAKIKRLDYLLLTFKKVLNSVPDCILLIIGEGPEEMFYKDLVKKIKIEEKVKFLGYINHNKLPEYYNISDVYVLSSIREQLSNTVMEAMACGIPVIATNVGGIPYLIDDGITGFLVPIDDINLLAKKIIFVLNNKSYTDKISKKSISKIRNIAKINIKLKYEEVLLNLLCSSHY